MADEQPTPAAIALAEHVAAVAAEKAARVRDRRTIRYAFLAGMATVLVVATPAAYFLDRDRQGAALERARFNCNQLTESADIQRRILQIGTDLRSDNTKAARTVLTPGAIERAFGSDILAYLYDRQARNERRAVRLWDVQLARLRDLAQTDCERVLQRSGVETTPSTATGPATITTR